MRPRYALRTNHKNLHVRGYKEEGTTPPPFDMTARNDLDRFHLAIDVLDRLPDADDRATHCKQLFNDKLTEHRAYIITRHGEQP